MTQEEIQAICAANREKEALRLNAGGKPRPKGYINDTYLCFFGGRVHVWWMARKILTPQNPLWSRELRINNVRLRWEFGKWPSIRRYSPDPPSPATKEFTDYVNSQTPRYEEAIRKKYGITS